MNIGLFEYFLNIKYYFKNFQKIENHFLKQVPKSYIPGPGDIFVILKTSLLEC